MLTRQQSRSGCDEKHNTVATVPAAPGHHEQLSNGLYCCPGSPASEPAPVACTPPRTHEPDS